MERVTDEQLVAQFLEDLRLQGKAERTISDYKSCLRVYRYWLSNNHLGICTVRTLQDKGIMERFLKYLRFEYEKPSGGSLSHKRLKSIFTALNGLYEYLEYNGLVAKNVVLTVRKRYLKQYKGGYVPAERKIIDEAQMRAFINSIANLRDKTMVVLLVKTGVRRNELIQIDVHDVDLNKQMITLKKREFHKRSNPLVFFDEETKQLLSLWLTRRHMFATEGEPALFVGQYGGRIDKNTVYDSVVKWAKRFGIYDSTSTMNSDHFSPHNLRHCFTTYLRQHGMPREFIKELRGDKRSEAIDIYDHIDPIELKREYLAAMPTFNIF